MEGAMLRRERGGSNHYHLRPKLQLLSNSGTETEEEELCEPKRRSRRKQYRKKRKKTCNNGSHWANLPKDLLNTISKNLTIVDFFNFGKVCDSWRSSFEITKHNFMREQAPLIIFIASRSKKLCLLYDISTNLRYKAKLPTLVGGKCLGCYSGYLILLDNHDNIRVTNPLTGHQIQFSNMPQPNSNNNKAIVASFGTRPDFALIVLSNMHQNIWYCISKENFGWKCLDFSEVAQMIVDLVIFDGKVYALTSGSRIAVLNLRSHKFSLITLEGTPQLGYCFRLVASKKRLFVVDFTPYVRVKVYTIDLERMKWVEVEDLGDEALFLNSWMCSRLASTINCQMFSNCVCYLPLKSYVFHMYRINGGFEGNFPFFLPHMNSKIRGWFFLDQAYEPDNIKDED